MTSLWLKAAVAGAALVTSACYMNGGGVSVVADDASPTDDASDASANVSFGWVYDNVLSTSCVGYCHGGGWSLDLSGGPDQTYANLLHGSAAACSGLPSSPQPFVVPGDPTDSPLYLRVSGTTCQNRMPLAGPALTQDQIDAINGWIAAGAPR